MKFNIKTSAVAVSETKFVKRGEYETEDQKEIERLRLAAQKFPQDVEELSSRKKEDSAPTDATSSQEEPKEEVRRKR